MANYETLTSLLETAGMTLPLRIKWVDNNECDLPDGRVARIQDVTGMGVVECEGDACPLRGAAARYLVAAANSVLGLEEDIRRLKDRVEDANAAYGMIYSTESKLRKEIHQLNGEAKRLRGLLTEAVEIARWALVGLKEDTHKEGEALERIRRDGGIDE